MPLTAPKDTLAYNLSRPLTVARDMSEVPCKNVASGIRAFMVSDHNAHTHPETEALTFYLLNHAMAEVRKRKAPYEPLGDLGPLVKHYYATVSPKAVRAFYYLLLICTRESRHVYDTDKTNNDLAAKFGKAALGFNKSIRNAGSEGAYKRFLNEPPDMPIGTYVRSLQWLFYHGGFSYGYGGPAWGKVADCLVSFVTGEYTAEMMMDTVWTLAHNNGPIFNKGMMYACHSGYLQRILDVQRSGQIPQMIVEDKAIVGYTDSTLQGLAKDVIHKFGMRNYVDWYLVEALGSVGKYSNEKKKQESMYGLPPELIEETKKKKEALEMAKKKAAEAEAKAYFEVMPGLKLKKIQPKRAA